MRWTGWDQARQGRLALAKDAYRCRQDYRRFGVDNRKKEFALYCFQACLIATIETWERREI